MTKRNWKFRVVKSMRGMNGEWFHFPTAGTFLTKDAACVYAEGFARSQGGSRVCGARIEVRSRSGGGHPGQLVAVYKSESYLSH